MKTYIKKWKQVVPITVAATLGSLIFSPLLALAQDGPPYIPLTGIPGVDPSNQTLGDYIGALFILSVSVAAILAVVKIAWGGIQYMVSDAFNTKEQAKLEITGALFGLGIILAAVVVLQTIYGGFVNLNVLQNADPLEREQVRTSSPSAELQNATQAYAERLAIERCREQGLVYKKTIVGDGCDEPLPAIEPYSP